MPTLTAEDIVRIPAEMAALLCGVMAGGGGSSLGLSALSYGNLPQDFSASTIAILQSRYPNLTPVAVQPEPIQRNDHLLAAALSPEARFAANCALIAQQRPDILHDLQQYPLVNMQLGPLPCGEVGGQVWEMHRQGWVALCHADAPTAGAEADVESIYSREITVYVLIGLGLGYCAVALAKRLRPWQRLLILDLDPCMFKAALYAVDIAPLFPTNGQRVDIFVGDQITTQAIEPWFMNLDAKEKLHLSMPLRTGYTGEYRKAEYDAVYAKCMEMLIFHAVGLSTWRQFGPCIGDNDLLNLPEYYQSPGYEHLKDLWKDKPAVCVAAGPSLQKNLRVLLDPGIRDNVALISAGTVYALVQGMGLAPDIVTTIDFQRLNWTDQFQYVPLDPHCPLVYLHSTYPQTPRRWPGPRFVAENASDTMNIFRPFCEGKKSAAIVQTVAHLNLLVALEMGANPIILVGQDLSMPLDTHHAAGARAQDKAPNEVPAEAFLDATDFAGKPVKTRHSFLSMKTVFERIIAAHPDRTILNGSEAGLALAGARNMPLAEILVPYRDQPTPLLLRPAIRAAWQHYVPQISETLVPAVEAIQAEVEALGAMARRVITFVREMGMDTAGAQQWIMQQEGVLQRSQRAWGLFAIRDFHILELLGAIPPEEAFSEDARVRDRVTCARMLQLAQLLAKNVEVIRRLLRVTRRRLETMHGRRLSLNRLLALQHYGAAAHDIGASLNPTHIPDLYAKMLYDTQQYDAALVVMQTWKINPQRQSRITRHLAAYRASTMQALPQYFPCPESPKSPHVTA